MDAEPHDQIGVLCVDDESCMCEALEAVFRTRPEGYAWKGSLPSADNLVDTVQYLNAIAEIEGGARVDVVVLDVLMIGKDVFASAAELIAHCPPLEDGPQVVFFSGSEDDRELALHSVPGSVWVDKTDGFEALLAAIDELHRIRSG